MDVAIKRDRATERARQRAARDERLWSLAADPNIRRLILLAGIISYSTLCARSKENVGPVQSALALALPGIGIPLLAADAGIKDKYALAAISAASLGYISGQMAIGWGEAGLLPSPSNLLGQMEGALQQALSNVNPFD